MKKNDKKRKNSKNLSFVKKISAFFKKSKFYTKFKNDSKDVKNNYFNTFEVLIIILISILFGAVVGCVICSNKAFSDDSKVGEQEIISTYRAILENYYGEVDDKELVNAAISGMIGVLDDPYSVYMDVNDTNSFLQNVDGSFVGIGVSVEWSDNIFRIIEVMDDSPAAKAGFEIDDIIIAIDGKDVNGLTLDGLTTLIKGKEGTKVSLTVSRDGEELLIKTKRAVVEIPSVTSDIFDGNIGYLAVDSFSSTTGKQFSKHLSKLEEDNIKSLIIDVRDNPGGKLGQVNEILDIFFDKNTILYKVVTKEKTTNVYAKKANKQVMPVVVLINHNSASASEMLASCFQENYKNSTIVGISSYGKGTIQQAVELSSGASVKYTTQSWLTSKGKDINEKGIIPDVIVEQSDSYCEEPSFANDLQLQKAIEILSK